MWNFINECLLNHLSSTIKDGDLLFSYAQIIDLTKRHGQILKSILKPKLKCAILCNSGLNATIALLSCWYAELIAIPMSKNYGPKHYEQIISLTGPSVIITDCNDINYNCTYNLNTYSFSGDAILYDSESLLSDVAVIMCTSGTTGKPKGTMITETGLKNNILAIDRYFKINFSDIILIARPIYHCAVLTGELLISLYKGVNIVFYNAVYNPMSVVTYAERCQITTLCGTPTLLRHISQFIKRSNKSLSIINIAISGECLNRETAKKIRDAFPTANIYNVYGLTEAAPRVSYLPPIEFDCYPESVGYPLNGVEIKIVDKKTGEELLNNTHGIVFVSSPCLMKGYYRNPELSNDTVRNGWLNTRDIGYKDEDGRLYILSRADDMIIKAGMNIYPKEIENAIGTIPEIAECMAYREKSTNGDSIVVDLVLNNVNEDSEVKLLMQKVKNILPDYLMPSKINIVKSLSRNASGKIVRYRDSVI